MPGCRAVPGGNAGNRRVASGELSANRRFPAERDEDGDGRGEDPYDVGVANTALLSRTRTDILSSFKLSVRLDTAFRRRVAGRSPSGDVTRRGQARPRPGRHDDRARPWQ